MSGIQVSIETVNNLVRRLSIIVPAGQLEQSKKKHLSELAKKVRLDGFRPGKVPSHVIERLHGERIWKDVVEESLQASLSTTLQEKALSPVGQLSIDSIKAEPGADLEYVVSFEVYPSVQVPELKGMTVERLQVDITTADVDRALEQMRKQHVEWSEVKRPTCYGDQILFDLITLSENGEESRKELQWVLEESKIPEGFSSLLSKVVGEIFPLSLPVDKGSMSNADVPSISASVEIKRVSEAKLLELDADFIKRLGVQAGTMEALRDEVRKHMQVGLERTLREKLKDQVIDALLVKYPLDELPQTLLDQEFQRLQKDVLRQREQPRASETEVSLLDEEKEILRGTARRRVVLGLLFNTFIEKHQLKIDETRVQEQVNYFSSAYQLEQVMQDRIYKDQSMMKSIRSSVLEEQVIEKLLEGVGYLEKTVEYADVMGIVPQHREPVIG